MVFENIACCKWFHGHNRHALLFTELIKLLLCRICSLLLLRHDFYLPALHPCIRRILRKQIKQWIDRKHQHINLSALYRIQRDLSIMAADTDKSHTPGIF